MTVGKDGKDLESVNASALNLDARNFNNHTNIFSNVLTTDDGRIVMTKLVKVANEGVTVNLGNYTQDYDIVLQGAL